MMGSDPFGPRVAGTSLTLQEAPRWKGGVQDPRARPEITRQATGFPTPSPRNWGVTPLNNLLVS